MATATEKSSKSSSKNRARTVADKKATAKSASSNGSAKADLRPCLCGCKTKVKRFFAPGHDARLKGMLLRGEISAPSREQKEFAKSHGFVIGANAE